MKNFRTTIVSLAMLFLLMNASLVYGTVFELWSCQTEGTPLNPPKQSGNTVVLTVDAKIVDVSRTADGYTVYRGGDAYITVEKGEILAGIFGPGTYTLRSSIGCVRIKLDTVFQPENIALWGRQTPVVEPRWERNLVVLSQPTTIVNFTYDGTDGMGLFRMDENPRLAFLVYLSPHNLQNPGPKVIDMAGRVVGTSLTGMTLLPGVYSLTPGRGTGVGIVYGEVVLDVGGGAGATIPIPPVPILEWRHHISREPGASSPSIPILELRHVDDYAYDAGAFPASKDYVQKNEKLAGDGTSDWCFPVRLIGAGTVDGISINNINGQHSVWDTLPGNHHWLAAVVSDGNVLNRSDGSVSFPINGAVDLDLYVADNNALKDGKTSYRITVRFSDGRVATLDLSDSRRANEAGAFPTSMDYVQKSHKLGGDGIPDWCFPVRLIGAGTVEGISIKNIDGQHSVWDTLPGYHWLAAVVSDDNVLNKSDGSVSFPINGAVDLDLYVADSNALKDGKTRYRITVRFSDGRVVTLDSPAYRISRERDNPSL